MKTNNIQRKKILLSANTLWYLTHFRSALIKQLNEDYSVVLVGGGDAVLGTIPEGIRIHTLSYMDRAGMNPIKDILLFLEYVFMYWKEKPDAVLNFTIKPNVWSSLACRMLHIPCVSTVTGLGYAFSKKGLLQSLVRFLNRFSLAKNTIVIFQNDGNRNTFIDAGIVPSHRTRLVQGSGVDAEYFSPSICSQLPENNHVTFTLVGRLLWDKGIAEFAAAAEIIKKEYPKTRFVLVGDFDASNPSGISKSVVKDWEEKGILNHAGYAADVRSHLCASDVIVLPSYHEGLSMSVLEAMAMEKPIIVTDIPGLSPLVTDGKNGYSVPVGSGEALAHAMKHMIADGLKGRQQMGKASRVKVVERFEVSLINAQYQDVVQMLLNSRL